MIIGAKDKKRVLLLETQHSEFQRQVAAATQRALDLEDALEVTRGDLEAQRDDNRKLVDKVTQMAGVGPVFSPPEILPAEQGEEVPIVRNMNDYVRVAQRQTDARVLSSRKSALQDAVNEVSAAREADKENAHGITR